ncbi:MAG: hypothetical protein KBT05_08395 [Bacteroidales bacterium]|nr:hypothetical protein [Candidatus Cryptobacteroides caccocaballi]
MKLSPDQKKAAKSILIYTLTFVIVFPIFHLIKGDFNWKYTLCQSGVFIVAGVIITAFYLLGMKTPEK